MPRSQWIDADGSTLNGINVVAALDRAGCWGGTVADLERAYPVGSIYSNGGIWFQRVYDTEVNHVGSANPEGIPGDVR